MERNGFGNGMRVSLVMLTGLLAITLPLKYVIAWSSPTLASALGAPNLRALPTLTITVVTISMALHALLMVAIVWDAWQLAKVFRTGVFFSKSNVVRIGRVGNYLLLTAALGVLSLLLGIWSVNLSGGSVPWSRAWAHIFDLPVGTLVCGLLARTMAQAFAEARQMTTDAKFTV